MKNSTKVTFLVESGVSLKTISKMNNNQISLMVERFKKSNKEENKEAITQNVTTSFNIPTADLEKGAQIPEVPGKKMVIQKTATGIKATPTESEIAEDDVSVVGSATAGSTTQSPKQVQAPDGMDDDGDATIDKEEDAEDKNDEFGDIALTFEELEKIPLDKKYNFLMSLDKESIDKEVDILGIEAHMFWELPKVREMFNELCKKWFYSDNKAYT